MSYPNSPIPTFSTTSYPNSPIPTSSTTPYPIASSSAEVSFIETSVIEDIIESSDSDRTIEQERQSNIPVVTQKSKTKKCAPIRQHLEELMDSVCICKICRNKWGANTLLSTITRHFEKKHHHTFKELRQTTLNFTRPAPYSTVDKRCVESLDHDLLQWIVTSQQPFSVTEEVSFTKLISNLDPRYKIPCHQTVSANIQNEFDLARINIKDVFKANRSKFALTLDVWTAYTQQPFLGITIHWVDTEWVMKTLLLDLILLHESHTGEYLGEKVLELVEDLAIKERLIGFTADNASNNQTCQRYLRRFTSPNFMYIRYAAHVLNLAVKEGQKNYVSQIKKARRFCNKIKYSPLLLEDMKRIAAILECSFLHPELDVKTRWNSTYLMLEQLVEIGNITNGLVQSNPKLKDDYLEISDWAIIKVSNIMQNNQVK